MGGSVESEEFCVLLFWREKKYIELKFTTIVFYILQMMLNSNCK